MKIIIVGAGRVGRNLAKSLTEEEHEVYLVENNIERVNKALDKLDVQVVVGSGTDPEILKKAYVDQADLVLAVTTSDETNLVVSSLAALLGAKRRIARVRNPALRDLLEESGYQQFAIDEIINPELVAAQEIVKIIQTPGASEVADFADGRILLRAFDVPENSPLCGMTMGELRDEDFPWPFLIVSLVRKEDVLIPKGDTVVQAHDCIYVLIPRGSLAEFLTFVDPDVKMPQKVVICGATIMGVHVAKALSGKIQDVILIEEDAKKANTVADQLESVRIILGSPSEADILTECGIEAADVFVGASNNDHSNLISSVLAKKMGAKETIIISQQPDYMSIVHVLDIDAIINPQALAVKQILRLVRGRGVSSVTKLAECSSEALEFIPEEGSPITKDVLKNIKLPKDSIVGAVCSGSEAVLATGDTQVNPGEKVIVFCQETAVKKLQKMFTKG